jgi:tocopherol O-methyltransferase
MIIPRSHTPDATSVAAHYDELDPFYRSVWGEHVHHGYWVTGSETVDEAVVNLIHLIAVRAGVTAGTRVCDMGCGYGATALILAEHYGADVTGITVSRKQFEVARRASHAGHLNSRFMLGDALESGLPAAYFDSVIAIESSEHMTDKPKFFAEARRLLRPDGRAVIAAWLARECSTLGERKYLLEPICAEGRLPSLASQTEYQEMLSAAGFRDIEYSDLTAGVRRTWSVCTRRFLRKSMNDPAFRRQWLDPTLANRIFARTIFRIWLAYRIGSMRYGVFAATK